MRVRVGEIALERKGWTMKYLSEILDVDHQTVLYWNQGRTYPRLPMLVNLCHILGCTFQDLIDME